MGFYPPCFSQEDRSHAVLSRYRGFNTGLRGLYTLGKAGSAELRKTCSSPPVARTLPGSLATEGSGLPQSAALGVLTSGGLETQEALDCPALTSPGATQGFQSAR